MVQQLVAGVHHFKRQVFRQQRELFSRLAQGQSPQTLFITCSDSRIDPNLITHTDPGELFIVRNAGNIVPPYSVASGGETASIEFAVTGLAVSDIVICGHSHCGAIKGLMHPEYLSELPAVAEWLKHAETTRRIVNAKYPHLAGGQRLDVATEENVLVQIEHLQTHPAVAVALSQGQLKLHAWVYDIASGDVFGYDDETQQFASLSEVRPPPAVANPRLTDVKSGDARFHPE